MEVIIGAVVSLFVQGVKKYFGTNEWVTLAVVACASLAAAAVYTGLQAYGFWDSFAHILEVAGAFYAFVLLRFKNA